MKDKLFLDTNVVVDLLGEREPFYEGAAKIATLADKGGIHLFVSAARQVRRFIKQWETLASSVTDNPRSEVIASRVL